MLQNMVMVEFFSGNKKLHGFGFEVAECHAINFTKLVSVDSYLASSIWCKIET